MATDEKLSHFEYLTHKTSRFFSSVSEEQKLLGTNSFPFLMAGLAIGKQ